MSSDDQLIHITSLLKARDYEQARVELTAFLKANPEQPEAWYLMSFAVGERARQIAALERALKLDPGFAKASLRLMKLQSAGAVQPGAGGSRRIGILIVAAMVLGLLVVLGVFVILPSFSAKPLPTALALPPTDTPKPPTLVVVNPATNIPTVAPAVTTVQDATSVSSTQPPETALSDTVTPENPASTQPTNVAENPSTTPETAVAAVPTSTPVQDVGAPTVQQPPQASATSGPATTATTGNPTVEGNPTTPGVPPTITVTVSGDPGVPLQMPQNVTNGTMRVVSAAFPATNAFKDMGVTAPAPPSGSQWALVEAFMTCTENVNCSPDAGSLKILGASGKTYPVTTSFSVSPIFGPDGYTPGQVWGYLEFAVTNNDQPLRLVLTQGSQSYTFALQ